MGTGIRELFEGSAEQSGVGSRWKFWFVGFLSAILILAIYLSWETDRPAIFLGGALAIIAVTTYATFFSKDSDTETRTRTAIAGAVIVTYLVFFALSIFSPALRDASRKGYNDTQEQQLGSPAPAEPAPSSGGKASSKSTETNGTIPSDLFGSFSWVTAAVIGFYFGGRTIERVAGKVTGTEAGGAAPAGTSRRTTKKR